MCFQFNKKDNEPWSSLHTLRVFMADLNKITISFSTLDQISIVFQPTLPPWLTGDWFQTSWSFVLRISHVSKQDDKYKSVHKQDMILPIWMTWKYEENEWMHYTEFDLTWITKYRPGSCAILANSFWSSAKSGLLSASVNQPAKYKFRGSTQ